MPQPRTLQQGNHAPVRTLAVVVLYRRPLAESRTLAGLAQAFAEDSSLGKQLDVLDRKSVV